MARAVVLSGMSYMLDVTLTSFPSQSRAGVAYEVRPRTNDTGQRWLSCNCPAWTRGSNQAGKKEWERTCKHTNTAMLWFEVKRFLNLQVNEIEFSGLVFTAAGDSWAVDSATGNNKPVKRDTRPRTGPSENMRVEKPPKGDGRFSNLEVE